MFVHFLRQLSVRSRIVGGFAILLVFLTLSIPLVVVNHLTLTNRVQQLEKVDARSDRLLLLSLSRVLSSRINLTRYADDVVPSPSEALSDVNEAIKLLDEARTLITTPAQQTATANILAGLVSYSTIVTEVQNARNQGRKQDIPNLIFNAYRIEFDLDQQIRAAVNNSETNVAAANKAALAEAQQRLILFISGYILVLFFAIGIAAIVQQSITQPISELRKGAEMFRLEKKETSIPHDGADELSILAQIFNQLTAELAQNLAGLEQHVAERTLELENRTAELENVSGHMKKRADQLQAVAQVGQAITSIQDIEDLLPQVTSITSERLGFYHVGVFLLDKKKEFAVLSAANSEGGKKMLERGHKLQVGAVGIVGYVASQGRPRIALDTGADSVFFNNPYLPGTHSEMALPLYAGSEIIGVLDVQSEQPAAFGPEDTELLTILANQVSIAIQNARRFQETQAAIQESETTIRQYLRKEWKSIIDETQNPGYGFSSKGLRPLEVAVVTPNMLQAIESGQTSMAQEESKRQMAIPIKLRGQVIGVMHLQSASQHSWGKDIVDITQAIADRVALAIDNARLLESSQAQASKERTIGEITSRIGASVNLRNVLQTAVEELGRVLPNSEIVLQIQSEDVTSQ